MKALFVAKQLILCVPVYAINSIFLDILTQCFANHKKFQASPMQNIVKDL